MTSNWAGGIEPRPDDYEVEAIIHQLTFHAHIIGTVGDSAPLRSTKAKSAH